MQHETQVRLIREALESIDRGAPPMTEAFTRNDPTAYTSQETCAARARDSVPRVSSRRRLQLPGEETG